MNYPLKFGVEGSRPLENVLDLAFVWQNEGATSNSFNKLDLCHSYEPLVLYFVDLAHHRAV